MMARFLEPVVIAFVELAFPLRELHGLWLWPSQSGSHRSIRHNGMWPCKRGFRLRVEKECRDLRGSGSMCYGSLVNKRPKQKGRFSTKCAINSRSDLAQAL